MGILNVTLNPNDKNGAWTLSNGNLTATTNASHNNIRATHGKISGKWYWEVKFDSGSVDIMIGIANKLYPITSTVYSGTKGDALNFRAYRPAVSGNKFPENVAYGTASVVGNVIGIALDLDNYKLEFYKNGVSMGVSHTNLSGIGEVFPFLKDYTSASKTITVNFGETAFAYPIPSGYNAYSKGYSVNKLLISNGGNGYKHDGTSWVNAGIIPTVKADRDTFYSTHGMDTITKSQLSTLSNVLPNGVGKISIAKV